VSPAPDVACITACVRSEGVSERAGMSESVGCAMWLWGYGASNVSRRVISLSRNYAPNSAAWIRAVARATRNQVNVAVHYGLSGDRAIVDSDIES
jgi:hypothetical protein